jgi:tetratricopeptide (TPR) repeat protein
MKRGFTIRLVLVGLALAFGLRADMQLAAQAPAAGTPTAGNPAASGQPGQAAQGGSAQKPAQADPNAFPENTDSVPLMPDKSTVDLPPGTFGDADASSIPLPSGDADPVRSPDDGKAESATGESSSNSGSLDDLLKEDDQPQPGGHRRMKVDKPEPVHTETAAEDLTVGKYYLDQKNWKAALSRLQSAMVLDPENPEVYWALAEADRHLGKFAEARANYEKVEEYDPDSKHAKEAAKALKDPEIANAKATPAGQAEVKTP